MQKPQIMIKKRIICIVQARMSSSRLPAKILLSGYDKPLLLHTVERLKKSKKIKDVIVATTKLKIDNVIFNLCKKNKIKVFRGHPSNLLDRYYKCAKKFRSDIIVRITSDCPLIDYEIVDSVIRQFQNKDVDYCSNMHPPSFPDGFDVEVFTFDSLRKTFLQAKKNFQKEHVTPYIWDNPSKFKLSNFNTIFQRKYYEKYRLTLDYKEDYYVIWKIYLELYRKKKFFKFKDIIKMLQKKPEILINRGLIKDNWYKHHYKELNTISMKDTKII